MKKPLEEMDERELLIEIATRQKRRTIGTSIVALATLLLAVTVLISTVILVPALSATLDHAYETLTQVQGTVTKVEESLSNINGMVGNINGFIESNTGALTDTVNNINRIDIDSLNKSIQDLDAIVGALARFFPRS